MAERADLWTMAGLCVDRAGRRVADGVTLSVVAGEMVALVGPNGAGKTSLLRAALGLAPRAGGEVRLNGADPARLSPAARARAVAYLPQARPLAWPLTARDVVALGRFAHGAGGRLGPADAAATARALAACGLEALADRRTDQLSGGELARVHVARALAAEAPVLAADEPTAALDPAQALAVMTTISAFCAGGGAALVVVHDLTLALRFATRAAVLAGGRLIADAPPRAALTPAVLRAAFGLEAAVIDAPGGPTLAVAGAAG